MANVTTSTNKIERGIKNYPRVGDAIYLADPSLLSEMITTSIAKPEELTLGLGRMDAAQGVAIRLAPEKLFGRHCGIFGATGGGKSWTLATLIHELKVAGGKAIILDPTGEFVTLAGICETMSFGPVGPPGRKIYFPFDKTTEDDLFSLLRPSGQSQGPRLRDAVKSLKLVRAFNGTVPQGIACNGGVIEKANKMREPYFSALRRYAKTVNSPFCNFDISNLAEQVRNECVWAASQSGGNFGNVETNALGHCETLIARINTVSTSKELECIFGTQGSSLVDELDAFLRNDSKDLALVSLKDVSFEHHTREILLNIIGRYILGLARAGAFKDRPIVVFLDEAHQFLGRKVGDEYGSVALDSFGLIAKEGRKYGLTCVLATQRPRDIPQDVLSQLGTLFVHRLTNQQDRETVEAACGDLDRGAAQFIPMLAPGEIVLIGPDLPASVPMIMNPPASAPDSRGPEFQKYWKQRRANPAPFVPDEVRRPQLPSPTRPESESDLNDEIPF